MPKIGKVVGSESLGGARLIELEVEPLGFVGGQYLIVDSGKKLADGRAAKRAYSILSSDEEQTRITFAVKNLGGPGSTFMHDLQVGDHFPFSGPWGKFLPDDARPRKTLIFATDTGITAALGLYAGKSFAPQRATTTVHWVRERSFLPDEWVRNRMPFEARPPSDFQAESLFLCGDGKIIQPLLEKVPHARYECFFNNWAKKSV